VGGFLIKKTGVPVDFYNFAMHSESVPPIGGQSQPSLTGHGGETMRAITAKNKGTYPP